MERLALQSRNQASLTLPLKLSRAMANAQSELTKRPNITTIALYEDGVSQECEHRRSIKSIAVLFKRNIS